ncbi:class II fumarate hydratase [Kroppenstedtia guangzhouensis]|uniref:Fumarate hydratase class II n=1 Tax=Kroppenstedtia guangzhouensis TaxID=1274356 RepID=A0ABQ1GV30_9BACL|nr:class II fumarate hydratase [Kroppenstedtia guangzhouensis]GGA50967.1 class II fumarate hydratase [Kroppenstedtia guangzhouensis]
MSNEYRIQWDSMGEVRVPAERYYGAQTQRAVENFPISGWRLPRRFIRAQGLIKAAAAYANQKSGELSEKKATAIIQAAEEVIDGRWDDHFVVDVYQAGAGTSQNMNANEVIANRAVEILGGRVGDTSLVHPNDDVNRGQSTNDTIHTAINIAAAEELVHGLLPSADSLIQGLRDKKDQFGNIVKSGRTHLQDAVPLRVGQELSGYIGALEQAVKGIKESLDLLYQLGLGGNAVGTGINTPAGYAGTAVEEIARRTGLPFRQAESRFSFMQNTGGALKTSGALKILAVHLDKLAGDLRLLGSGPRTGLAEFRLPPVQPGSSIMPGKVNPVMAEMMNMITVQVIGNDAAITAAGQHAQLELNVMMPVIAHNLLHSIQIMTHGMEALRRRCIDGLEVDPDRCGEWMEKSLALATALNPVIGYDRAAEVAKKAYQEGKTVRQVILEERILSVEEADRILNPNNLIPGDD